MRGKAAAFAFARSCSWDICTDPTVSVKESRAAFSAGCREVEVCRLEVARCSEWCPSHASATDADAAAGPHTRITLADSNVSLFVLSSAY